MARRFNNAAYISNTSAATLGAAPLTIAAFIRWNGSQSWNTVFTNARSTSYGWYWVRRSASNAMSFYQFAGGVPLASTLTMSANLWYGIALSIQNGTTSRAYVYRFDTNTFSAETLGGPTFNNGLAPNDVRIGMTAGNSEGFNGEIARVAWWQGLALNDNEIRSWFLGVPVRADMLRGYWELHGTAGSVEPDWSKNKFHGTVSGGGVSPLIPPFSTTGLNTSTYHIGRSASPTFTETPSATISLPTSTEESEISTIDVDETGRAVLSMAVSEDGRIVSTNLLEDGRIVLVPRGPETNTETPSASFSLVPTESHIGVLLDASSSAFTFVMESGDRTVAEESPSPDVLFRDDFARSNNTSLGTPWVEGESDQDAFVIVDGRLEIRSSASGGVQGFARYDRSVPDNQFSQLTFVDFDSSVVINGPACRIATASTFTSLTAYTAFFDRDQSRLELHRYVAQTPGGDGTILGTYGVTLSPNDIVRIEAVGSSIRVILNNAVVIQATDATITSGQVGVATRNTGAGGYWRIIWDQWRGGTPSLALQPTTEDSLVVGGIVETPSSTLALVVSLKDVATDLETPYPALSFVASSTDFALTVDVLAESAIFTPSTEDIIQGEIFAETPSLSLTLETLQTEKQTAQERRSETIVFATSVDDSLNGVFYEVPSATLALLGEASDTRTLVADLSVTVSTTIAGFGAVLYAPIALEPTWTESVILLELIDTLTPAWLWYTLYSIHHSRATTVEDEWVAATNLLTTEGFDGVSWAWTDVILDQSVYPAPSVTYDWVFTASAATEVFTTTGHTLGNGDAVTLEGASLPGGITAGETYFVINASITTFQLATIPGGTPIDLSSDGSGTVYLNVGGPVAEGTTLSPLPSGVPTEVTMKR